MSANVETAMRGPAAYGLARKALEAMESHKVWPTSQNFELWLHYCANRDTPLGAEISQMIEAGEPFTDPVADALAARHLPKAKLNGELLVAGESLSKELEQVSAAIESARETSEAYGEQLSAASQTLDADDVGSIKAMVQTLTSATELVQRENKALESRLADTTAEVGRLKEHLEQVRRDAMTDGLTNLANRKAFDETLERACQVAEESGAPLNLAIVDIDHFKKFNDTWGHQTGDQVIRYVASVMAKVGAAPRLAARYGGEEFAIIFPAEDGRTVMAALEEIRIEVGSRALKRRSTNEDLGMITVSAGLAQRKPGESVANLVERADEALYASKRNGRNRVTSAEAILSSAAA